MAKRLYTEANVRELPAGSELVLGKEAIATPAALELAFTRGIRVHYRVGGDPETDRTVIVTTPPGALWTRLLAADGDYVVQVKAGTARVFQLGPTGPVLLGEGS